MLGVEEIKRLCFSWATYIDGEMMSNVCRLLEVILNALAREVGIYYSREALLTRLLPSSLTSELRFRRY